MKSKTVKILLFSLMMSALAFSGCGKAETVSSKETKEVVQSSVKEEPKQIKKDYNNKELYKAGEIKIQTPKTRNKQIKLGTKLCDLYKELLSKFDKSSKAEVYICRNNSGEVEKYKINKFSKRSTDKVLEEVLEEVNTNSVYKVEVSIDEESYIYEKFNTDKDSSQNSKEMMLTNIFISTSDKSEKTALVEYEKGKKVIINTAAEIDNIKNMLSKNMGYTDKNKETDLPLDSSKPYFAGSSRGLFIYPFGNNPKSDGFMIYYCKGCCIEIGYSTIA